MPTLQSGHFNDYDISWMLINTLLNSHGAGLQTSEQLLETDRLLIVNSFL